MQTDSITLTRRQAYKILKRRRGLLAEIARQLNLSPSSLTEWSKGRFPSVKIEAAIMSKALELLAREQEQAKGAA